VRTAKLRRSPVCHVQQSHLISVPVPRVSSEADSVQACSGATRARGERTSQFIPGLESVRSFRRHRLRCAAAAYLSPPSASMDREDAEEGPTPKRHKRSHHRHHQGRGNPGEAAGPEARVGPAPASLASGEGASIAADAGRALAPAPVCSDPPRPPCSLLPLGNVLGYIRCSCSLCSRSCVVTIVHSGVACAAYLF
jgi:hypothetical protein